MGENRLPSPKPFPSRGQEQGRFKSETFQVEEFGKGNPHCAEKIPEANGGREPLPPPNDAQQKMLDLCADTPAFDGLQGADSEEVHKESK